MKDQTQYFLYHTAFSRVQQREADVSKTISSTKNNITRTISSKNTTISSVYLLICNNLTVPDHSAELSKTSPGIRRVNNKI